MNVLDDLLALGHCFHALFTLLISTAVRSVMIVTLQSWRSLQFGGEG